MPVAASFQVRNGVLAGHERSASIEVVHQIVLLHGQIFRSGDADGAGIVDEDVQTAEFCGSRLNGLCDVLLAEDVALNGQCFAAGFLNCKKV